MYHWSRDNVSGRTSSIDRLWLGRSKLNVDDEVRRYFQGNRRVWSVPEAELPAPGSGLGPDGSNNGPLRVRDGISGSQVRIIPTTHILLLRHIYCYYDTYIAITETNCSPLSNVLQVFWSFYFAILNSHSSTHCTNTII